MADSDVVYRREIATYCNDAVRADIVQQGTGNAGRDINNSVYIFARRLYYESYKTANHCSHYSVWSPAEAYAIIDGALPS